MIKVYTGRQGLLISLLFLAGVVFFISIFFWGITKTIEFFLPFLVVASYLMIMAFLLGFLPATYIKELRPSLCVYSLWMSRALGVTAWLMSFLFIIKGFGALGILVALFLKYLSPIALVVAVFKGSWPIAGHLTVWMGCGYGMKFYSMWLLNLENRYPKRGEVIDVDADVKDDFLDSIE